MPIYAYKCSSCGHADDVLQKMSAAPLTDCPACGKSTYSKQVTAPQFQLKGSGWYVTDFRGGNKPAKDAPATTAAADAKAGLGEAKPAETKSDAPAACPVHNAPAATPAAAPAAKPAAASE